MRYVFLIAVREYIENAKTKGFWIGLFMFPLLIFVSAQVSILLQTKATPVRYYILVDQSGEFASLVENRVKDLKPRLQADNSGPLYVPLAVPAMIDTNADLALLARDLKPYLRGQKSLESNGRKVPLYAAILIPRDIEKKIVRPPGDVTHAGTGAGGIEYWSANLTDPALRDEVQQTVNKEIRRKEALARGLDIEAIRQLEQTHAPFASLNPNKEKGQETVNEADIIKQWAPSAFVYLLWVAIIGISQMLLNNIIEEKSNRIIEVLLSSVTPGELMMGKLFGIAAIGLTMVGVWITAMLCGLSSGHSAVTDQLLATLKTSNLIPMFALYFLLGYLMYASFIMALGSVCNTIKEAQSYMALVTMTMMVPLLTMTFIPKDPNGTLARVLSWIPIYTPFTMMNRINAHPPAVDVFGTLALLVVSTAGALWMTGKVFRIGILRTGQPPRILEILRWLRH